MWSKAECRDLGERGGSDPVVGTFLKERGPRFLPRGTRCAHVSWKPVQSAFTQPIFSPQELFLVFKEEKKKSKKKKNPFTAWLLAYCAAEAVSSKGTSPPAAGGVFVGLPSLAPLLPAANADIPPPRDKASLSPWDISVSVRGRGAPGLTPSPRGAPSTLPPARWSSAGISQPFHCVHGFRCPFSQEGGQTTLEHCEFSNTGAGLLQEDRRPLAAGPVRMPGPRRAGVSNRMPERTRQVTGTSGLGQVRGDREWRGLWGTGQRAPRGRGRGKLSSR